MRATRLFPSEAPRITGLGRVTGGDEAAASDTHQLGFMHICSHDAENERDGTVATYTLLGSVEDDGVGVYVLCVADLAGNAFRAVSAFEFHHLGGLAGVHIVDGPLAVFCSQGTSCAASLFVADCRRAKARVRELECSAAAAPGAQLLQVASVVRDPHVCPTPHLLLRVLRDLPDCTVCRLPQYDWWCLSLGDIAHLMDTTNARAVPAVLGNVLRPCRYIPTRAFACSPCVTVSFVPLPVCPGPAAANAVAFDTIKGAN